MSLVLKELDTSELSENVEESLREDNISESCYTNFQDAVVQTIGKTLSELLEKDGWKIKRSDEISMFDEKDTEKIFNAFINNSEFTVTLKKQVDKQKYEFKEVIVKFDFSENEKKEIAKVYIDVLLEGLYYLDICLFVETDEETNEDETEGEINVDTVSKILSNEVHGLLSPDEIKTEFADKIESAINIIFGSDTDDVSDIDE